MRRPPGAPNEPLLHWLHHRLPAAAAPSRRSLRPPYGPRCCVSSFTGLPADGIAVRAHPVVPGGCYPPAAPAGRLTAVTCVSDPLPLPQALAGGDGWGPRKSPPYAPPPHLPAAAGRCVGGRAPPATTVGEASAAVTLATAPGIVGRCADRHGRCGVSKAVTRATPIARGGGGRVACIVQRHDAWRKGGDGRAGVPVDSVTSGVRARAAHAAQFCCCHIDVGSHVIATTDARGKQSHGWCATNSVVGKETGTDEFLGWKMQAISRLQYRVSRAAPST